MLGAAIQSFSPMARSGRRRSAAIDTQLLNERLAMRRAQHVLVLGPAGAGKSSLLRLLAPAADVRMTTHGGDRGGAEEDRSSTIGNEFSEANWQGVPEADVDQDLPKRRTDPIANDVLVDVPGGFQIRFTEVPSTMSPKVTHQFERGPLAFVFVVDLSSYDSTTQTPDPTSLNGTPGCEPPEENRLRASLDLLETLLYSLNFFRMEPVVLFTKADQLAERLEVTPFRLPFPAFLGNETVGDVAQYLFCQVKKLGEHPPENKPWICPALLNLAEEDEARRADMRAGILAYIFEILAGAGMPPLILGPEHGERQVGGVIASMLAKVAWDGEVLSI